MAAGSETPDLLSGKRIAFVGRLAFMNRREAAQLVRRHGAVVLDEPAATAHLVVLGEEEFPLPDADFGEGWLDEACRKAAEAGTLEIVTESQLWQRLGLVEPQDEIHRLYTPAMLAELLHVSVAVIRRWHRRGLIVPVKEIRRLPYFDFQEVATARRLAHLLAAGVAPREIERKLAALARFLPGVERPVAQLSVIVEGKEILLRQGDGLIESGGQFRFDFESWEAAPPRPPAEELPSLPLAEDIATSPQQMRRLAAALEEEGRLAEAAAVYRAELAATGPVAETCFQLAELLYRLGDLTAARERYYMAIEIDEDYVEARANLGCVLAETGQRELAVAAFEGALRYHGGYADVHYHLARTLDELGRRDEALSHWQTFAAMAADSPWAEEARARIKGATGSGKE
jgi:DNA-binding transcriptional MerR regulator